MLLASSSLDVPRRSVATRLVVPLCTELVDAPGVGVIGDVGVARERVPGAFG